MSDVRVSIFLLTYNQEEFIGQTIESVLDQRTDFKCQLVIGEDCSTDNTRQICEKYACQYPEMIKLLPSEENIGLIKNFIRTYEECDGKYIAICDGDDYWTDPLKLQKQVDFLEANPDHKLVFTSFNFLFPDGTLSTKDYSNVKKQSDFSDLIQRNYISSVTAVFKNKEYEEDLPKWLHTCPYGDWPLYLWATREGAKIGFLPEVTAVYRREIGMSEKMKYTPSSIAKANLNIVSNVAEDANFKKYREAIEESLNNHRLALIACYIREKKYKGLFVFTTATIAKIPLAVLNLYLYMFKKSFFNKG